VYRVCSDSEEGDVNQVYKEFLPKFLEIGTVVFRASQKVHAGMKMEVQLEIWSSGSSSSRAWPASFLALICFSVVDFFFFLLLLLAHF
jgi:hypothetical protein